MKENLYITITDVKGSRHFTLNQVIKKYLVYFVLGIVLVFIFMGISLTALRNKLEQYQDIRKENINLLQKQAYIEDTINSKTLELEEITDKFKEVSKIMKSDDIGQNMTLEPKLNSALLNAVERRYLLAIIPSGNPIKPFKGYTSGFGVRVHPVTKVRKKHWGLDFKAKRGTKIVAAANGVVEFSGWNSGYGKLVIISHNFGFKTYYAHQSKLKVKVGDFVTKGQLIGLSGNTGMSSGPHLHYEIHYLGKKLNPINFAKWNFKDYKRLFEKERKVQWQSLVKIIRSQQQLFQLEGQQQ